jgi:oleate hydratase
MVLTLPRFAFQPWHSAIEFKRYLHRFIQEFPRINSLAGVDRTPYNQYDSIILPIETYLKARGVKFQYSMLTTTSILCGPLTIILDTRVNSFSFSPTATITVSEIHFLSDSGGSGIIHVQPNDIVFATLGSMTSCSSFGSNTTAPAPLPESSEALQAPDGAWHLWSQLANPEANPHFRYFGRPSNFYSRTNESNWLSFTVTLKDPAFFERLEEWTGNKAGTGALVTFKDSAWMMSIVVPHQPHFLSQAEGTQVFWGYGLFPNHVGDFVKKPMASCFGSEIMTELLGHLQFPEYRILENTLTIPCMMPYITSQFLTRTTGDRPEVIPKGSTNLALLGQFVEIPKDTVFTVEYSVRSAQMAVHRLMGTEHRPKDIYMGEHNLKVLFEALRRLLT